MERSKLGFDFWMDYDKRARFIYPLDLMLANVNGI